MDSVALVLFLDPGAFDRFADEEVAVVLFDFAVGANCFLDIVDARLAVLKSSRHWR